MATRRSSSSRRPDTRRSSSPAFDLHEAAGPGTGGLVVPGELAVTDDAPEPPAVAGGRAVLAAAAAVACVLPWEHLDVAPPGGSSTTPLNGLHGWGVVACAGAVIALLAVAERAWRPAPWQVRDAATAVAGVALVAGAALFQRWGGYPIGSSVGGQSSVSLGPGLPIAGAAGLLLAGLSLARVWLRRGGSRSPVSGGAA